jgi:hypothetical protein
MAGSSLVRQDGSTVVAGDIAAMSGTDTPQVSVQGSRQNAAVTVRDTGASLSEICMLPSEAAASDCIARYAEYCDGVTVGVGVIEREIEGEGEELGDAVGLPLQEGEGDNVGVKDALILGVHDGDGEVVRVNVGVMEREMDCDMETLIVLDIEPVHEGDRENDILLVGDGDGDSVGAGVGVHSLH